jgi:hypothetical protein
MVACPVLDVSDPVKPSLIALRNWCPPFGDGSHTALPPLERQLVIVADESIADHCEDQVKRMWVVDEREPTNPVTVSTFLTPAEDDYCAKGGHFGPHNLHENRPGSFQSSELIFAAYQNAGARVFKSGNQFWPPQGAYYVPPAPEKRFDSRPASQRLVQTCDVVVDRNGMLHVTDYNAGLYTLEYNGQIV